MRILFLCVANSARSQMAEGIARAEWGNDVAVLSAGSQPKAVNPLAVKVMEEIGIDISRHKSKSIDSLDISNIDIIITLCEEEICPVVFGNQKKIHWPLRDPANPALEKAEQVQLFRQIRNELKKRIHEFKINLKPSQ